MCHLSAFSPRQRLRCSWLIESLVRLIWVQLSGPGQAVRPRALSASSFQGLYCVSVNCMDNAEAQFTTALRVRCRPSHQGAGGASQ